MCYSSSPEVWWHVSDLVIVPTDKPNHETNSIELMKTTLYSIQGTTHLTEDAVKTTHTHLQEIFEITNEKLESFRDLLDDKEFKYIKSTISKHNIATVCPLVKDHNNKDENGNPSTRLVVPTNNFTAGFPHVGQKEIKDIIDWNNINYSKKTTVQVSDLKQKLEELDISRSTHTLYQSMPKRCTLR